MAVSVHSAPKSKQDVFLELLRPSSSRFGTSALAIRCGADTRSWRTTQLTAAALLPHVPPRYRCPLRVKVSASVMLALGAGPDTRQYVDGRRLRRPDAVGADRPGCAVHAGQEVAHERAHRIVSSFVAEDVVAEREMEGRVAGPRVGPAKPPRPAVTSRPKSGGMTVDLGGDAGTQVDAGMAASVVVHPWSR